MKALPPALLALALAASAEETLPLPYSYENMAQVNGEVVLKRDVVKRLGRRVEGLKNAARSPEEFARDLQEEFDRALFQLVGDTVVRQQAKKDLIEVSEEEVDVREREIVEERAGGDREKFKDLIAQSGIGISEWREMLKDQICEEIVLRRRMDMNASFVPPAAVADYYRSHPQEFRRPDRVRLTLLRIAWRRGAEERALRLAEGLKRQVEAGADFKGLTRWSDADLQRDAPVDLDWRARGDLEPALAEAAFGAAEGAFVGPIRGESGIYLARVEGREAGKDVSFEDAQAGIIRKLRSEQMKEQYQEARMKLMTSAVIQFKPEHLQRWYEDEKAKLRDR